MNKLLIIFLAITSQLMAFTPSEKAKISVLTCSSGFRVFDTYGHCSIRYKDEVRNKDIVYNYGLFDFSSENFIWRYLKGENRYILGRESYKRFHYRYQKSGQGITEQVLNLDSLETITLIDALEENAKQENREYLYNVFYDNCATRIYNIIDAHQDGGIKWKGNCDSLSFRDLMHSHNYSMPFSQLGIDIVFGTKADRVVSCMDQMFLPVKLKEGLDSAKKNNGKKLIKEKNTILKETGTKSYRERILFHTAFILLLILCIIARLTGGRFLHVTTIGLSFALALTSLVVFFIDYFSIHPTILPNLNHIWINPLWFIVTIIYIFKKNQIKVFKNIMNSWCIAMVALALLSCTDVLYLHLGALYIIASITALNFKINY